MPHRTAPRILLAVLGLVVAAGGPAAAQSTSPLRVTGLIPGGLRASVTERWGELSFTIHNPSDGAREARVVVFHEGEEFTEFARDLWVPANVNLTVWMSFGPLPKARPDGKPFSTLGRQLNFILYDKTDGKPAIVRPQGEEKLRDRVVLYRPKSDTTTALFTDVPAETDPTSFRKPAKHEDATALVRVMRSLRKQSEYLSNVSPGALPATAEAYDGVDQIVVAGNHFKNDPHGRAALRQWVERGGELWVMLDQVEADLLGSILGEECAPQVVDRTSLTSVRFGRTLPADRKDPTGEKTLPREHEHPVDFVRVALTGREIVYHYVDDWPASFSIRVGRGRLLVTTVGARAWVRPRGFAPLAPGGRGAIADPPSPFDKFKDLPVALDPFLEVVAELKVPEPTVTPDDLRPMLLDEIGYTVPNRGTVIAILGAFVAALAGIGWLVRRSRRTEIVGWLAPGAAALAAGAFYVFGGAARHAIPPTAAVVELAEAVPGSGEVARTGVFAAYQPTAGPLPLAAPRGGVLDFDFDGLDGQNRMRVQTDRDAWHNETLAVPAGVRQGQYRSTIAGAASAVARFGPDGVRGRFTIAGFQNLEDAILVARNRDATGAALAADGTFRIGADEAFAPGQYLAGTVLTDRQQRRQEIYRKLVGRGLPDHYDTRDFLLAWATPDVVPFKTAEGSRTFGHTLLSVPIDYERPAPGTEVIVPRAFLGYRRWLEGRPRATTMESTRPIDMRLRFQVPESIVPLDVAKATFLLKIRAPAHRVTVNGYAGETPSKVFAADAPTDPVRVELTDPRLLKLDATGGLHVGLAIDGLGPSQGSQQDTFWTIESIHLELTGRTAGTK